MNQRLETFRPIKMPEIFFVFFLFRSEHFLWILCIQLSQTRFNKFMITPKTRAHENVEKKKIQRHTQTTLVDVGYGFDVDRE